MIFFFGSDRAREAELELVQLRSPHLSYGRWRGLEDMYSTNFTLPYMVSSPAIGCSVWTPSLEYDSYFFYFMFCLK